jgi:membrane protein involved in colicin uptake
VQHRQETEVVAAEEHERAAVETAATTARATRRAMSELAAARAEVEAAAAADAARVAAAELEALRASSTGNSVSADDDRDNELKLAREAAQWAAAHSQGRRGGSPDGPGRVDDAPSGGARGGRAPDGGGSPDRRGRASGWVDGDRDLYRRRDSPSPDGYHGHHGIQAIVMNVGPGCEWPTLTKTNYVEWATVMRVQL